MSISKPLLQQPQSFQPYNPYKSPPNIALAQQHRQATRVGIDPINPDTEFNFTSSLQNSNNELDSDDNVKLCPCCGEAIHKQSLLLMCKQEQLLFLGTGYPVFFKLSKYFNVVLLFVFFVSGSGFWFLNTLNCTNRCIYFLQIPIINLDQHGKKTDNFSDIIHFLIAIAIMLFCFFIRKRMQSQISSLQQKIISPDQYTIIVQNLPEDASEDQLIDWSKQLFGVKPLIINFAYDISELRDAYEQRLFFTIKMNRLVIRRNQSDQGQKGFLSSSIKQVKDKLDKYDKIIQYYKKENIVCRKIGTVFMTYPERKNVRQILKKYETNFFHTLLNRSLTSFRDKSAKFQGISVVIRGAPAPRQIIWQNLSFSFIRYIITQLLGILTMLVILFISFKIQLKLATWSYKFHMYEQTDDDQQFLFDAIESLFISLMIMLVNLMLRFVIKAFIGIKKHYSYSRYQSSFCFYYAIMYVFNTCFMIYIVHIRHPPVIQENIAKKQLLTQRRDHILIYDIHLLILMTCLSQPLYKLIDPVMWGRIFFRKHIAGLPAHRNPYTQAYANSLWEEYSISNIDNYQYIFRILVVSVWFSYPAPFGLLLACLSLFLDYWLTKYLLLFMYRKPQHISKRIAVPFLKLLPFLPLVYLCGVLQYVYRVSDTENVLFFIVNFLDYWIVIFGGIVITIAIYFFGYWGLSRSNKQKQSQNNQKSKIKNNEDKRYDQVQIIFQANYDTQNPMNKIKSQIKYAFYGALKKSALKGNSKIIKQLTLSNDKYKPLTKKAKVRRGYSYNDNNSDLSYRSLQKNNEMGKQRQNDGQRKNEKRKIRRLQTMQVQLKESTRLDKDKYSMNAKKKQTSSDEDDDY